MSEKLCLWWDDFQENMKSAFGKLREDNDFADVTLVCEDGQQVEAHKVISLFFFSLISIFQRWFWLHLVHYSSSCLEEAKIHTH